MSSVRFGGLGALGTLGTARDEEWSKAGGKFGQAAVSVQIYQLCW